VAFPFASIAHEEPDAAAGGTAEAAAEADPAVTPVDTGSATPEDYSWVPEAHMGEDGKPDFQGLRTAYDDANATLAAMTEGRPESAADYQIALDEAFDYGEIQPPEWFKFEIDNENPIVGELQTFLHENGLPAEAGTTAAGIMARYEARRAAQYAADRETEMKALGPQGQARIDKIIRAAETRISNKAQRDALLNSMVSADAIRAMEALINGGAPTRPITSSPRVAADENISPFERLRRANQQSA